MWRRGVLVALLVATLGVLAALLTSGDPRDSASRVSRASSIGTVDGITLAGFGTPEPVELESFRGRPLVINAWASWCLICALEMPDFQDVYEKVSSRVEFLGIDIQDDLDAARRLAKATAVRYPLAADTQGAAYRRLRGVAMPTTWFVDAEGRIVERFSGPLTSEQLASRIRKHFGS